MRLNIFNTADLFEAATNLFQQLNIQLNSNTAEPLPTKDILKHHYKNNDTFKAIDKTYFIGIIDDSVFKETGLFDIYSYKEAVEQGNKHYNGLMLFALELSKYPTRTEISEITRAFNRISHKMPVALLLKYSSPYQGEVSEGRRDCALSIAISERFKYLQHWRQGEKAGKVIILRDIHTENTHAGHIRILQDLVKPVGVTTYEQLHQHWLQVLDVNILNKKFFQDLSNWYFAAMNEVSFPDDVEKKRGIRNATNLIRLITRVIFIWFLKEKQLVPASLFRKDSLAKILKDFNKNKQSHNYYNAILQNLFFGTLNQKREERKFAKEGDININKEEYGVKNLFRYADLFTIPEKEVLALFEDVPFLNGGLFDCLDKPNDESKIEYVDGFSRNPKKRATVPDFILFGEEKEVDLNEVYGTKNKRYSSRGLINLLESYKFTVAENTPIEEEIALDPELLGKVFENLLASYNPETQTTARKQTGSFYTPREIVNYMVDESLIEYLKSNLTIPSQDKSNLPVLTQEQTLAADESEQIQDDVEPYETFFNPYEDIEIYTGNLPHWQQQNVWYFVTFRLADSIPANVAKQIEAERKIWLKKNKKNKQGKYTNEQIREYYRLFCERIENLLNSGKGSCILKEPGIARIVADVLNHFNNIRYILDEWVIMPNHIHVLVKPLGEHKLHEITHSWKSYTANEINKVLGKKGQLWMRESYDHIVRNEKALNAIRNYIRHNPVKANLKAGSFLASGPNRSKDASDTLEGRLRQLLSYSEDPNPFNEAETQAIIEAINNCKILDPACGSGAFPMGILHKMVHILQKLDPENKYWKELQRKKAIEETEEAFKIGDKEERAKRLAEINDVFENNASDYGRKLYLIENCIYGIDIQPIAVQIAKLRFFISLIVDQKVSPTSQLDNDQKASPTSRLDNNRGIRPLPNLETKFVAANTLIGLEKPQQLTIRNPKIDEKEKELKDLRHEYFTANTRKEKLALQRKDKQLRKEIAQLLKASGWHSKVAEQIASFDPYDQNHFANWFDPEWMFGIKVSESSGFDIIIGNPPYIQLQKDGGRLAKEYAKQNFQTFERTGDIYSLFYEKGMQLLKNGGHLCYITSNKWMRAGYGKSTRAFFLQFNPIKLIDLGSGVFESATVDTNILLIQKAKNQHQLQAADLSKSKNPADLENAPYVTLRNLTTDSWTISSEIEQRIKAKIEAKGKPLKDWDIQINYGIKTGYNEAFIIDGKKRAELIAQDPRSAEIIKPLLRGRDIKRYKADWQDLWLIATFPALKLNIDDYPAVREYLKSFGKKLYQTGEEFIDENGQKQKTRKKTGNKWFETQDQIAYYQEFEKEKIIYPNMTLFLPFIYDDMSFYTNQKCFIITSNSISLKFLVGFFNSKVAHKWIRENCPELQGGTRELSKIFFQNIPIPDILESQQRPIVSLVEQILAKKEKGKDTTALEQQIDNLVYRLYDLTYEEVKVIDPAFALSKKEYEAIQLE